MSFFIYSTNTYLGSHYAHEWSQWRWKKELEMCQTHLEPSRPPCCQPPMATPPSKGGFLITTKEGLETWHVLSPLETAGWKWVGARDAACLKPLVCFFFTLLMHIRINYHTIWYCRAKISQNWVSCLEPRYVFFLLLLMLFLIILTETDTLCRLMEVAGPEKGWKG